MSIKEATYKHKRPKGLNFYVLLVFVLFAFNVHSEVEVGSVPFVTTWKTDNIGVSNDNQIIIPTIGGGYSYNVDWGDGTITTGETGDAIHTYAIPGLYQVSITGDFPRIYFNNSGDKEKLVSIDQWGNNVWDSMLNAFRGCDNLEGNFSDTPDLSQVISMSYMFYDASSFNSDIGNWDVSNVTDMSFLFSQALSFNKNIGSWDVGQVSNMSHMFDSATSFDQDISNWDVSNVTDMSNMFNYAISFNQNLDNWDVGNVTDMSYMFLRASSFNGAISNWNVSSAADMSYMFFDTVLFNSDIGNWDVSNVSDMSYMFTNATSFNQDIGNWNVGNVNTMAVMFFEASSFNQDISQWNVGNVTDMSNMFYEAISFDQNIGNWNVSNVTDMSFMFQGVSLSFNNYDALLIGWNSGNLQFNVPFNGGLSQYCQGTSARVDLISTYNWDITDGGTIGPKLDDIPDLTVSNYFVLPTITGSNLTGNELYYTAPNGSGIPFGQGDVISFNDFSSYPVTLYMYDYLNLGCGSEQSFELTITSEFSCTGLLSPRPGDLDVIVDTNLSWVPIIAAAGYRLSIGTASNTSDILDSIDVGNVFNYNLPTNLPENTEIFVTISPYNEAGDTLSCSEEPFTTGSYSNSSTKVPKFFSPNGDGVNDFWVVPDPSNSVERINILDRYGKLIYEVKDNSIGWDGTYKNLPLKVDDYWFIIQYKTGENFKGHFSLLR